MTHSTHQPNAGDHVPAPTLPAGVPVMADEAEIDLRIYLDILLKWWREIVAITLLAALAAGLLAFIRPRSYEATALVAPIRSRTEVSFDPRFRSISEDETALAGNAAAAMRQAQLQAFAAQAKNPAIAESLLREHPELFAPEDPTDEPPTPAQVLRMVQGEVVQDSDLIAITVTHRDPATAAAIANLWAAEFATVINRTYGREGSSLAVIEQQADEANATYKAAEEALRQFTINNDRISELERLAGEKETIIQSLRAGKQAAVTAVIDRQVQIQSELVDAYLKAGTANRLLAFDKGQETKRAILTEWLNYEQQSRLAALRRDLNLRQQLFNKFVEAEASSKLAVFDEQVSEKINNLSQRYARKNRYEKFLQDAQALLSQIEAGGEAGAASNALAIQLLKAQIFASSQALPAELQLAVSGASGGSASQQAADLTALIGVLEQQLTAIDAEIAQLSEELLQGSDYAFLDELDPVDWTVPLTDARPALAATAPLTAAAPTGDTLSQKILERYADLYQVGQATRFSGQIDETTPLYEEIQQNYPRLFEKDRLTELSAGLPEENELTAEARAEARRLLNLEGLENLLSFSVEDEPLTQEISRLEREVRELKAEIARLAGERQALAQSRDLAWETYKTLSNKAAELTVADPALDSEVRFAVAAAPPTNPAGRSPLLVVLIAAVLGGMSGVFLAFMLEYLGQQPFLRRWGRRGGG